MQISQWLIAGAVELYILLLLLCLFLVFNIRSLRNLVRKLRAKIKSLVEELNQARQDNTQLVAENAAAACAPQAKYREQLQQQLDLTQAFHEELPGSANIETYLDSKHPIQRQSLALRHALLSVELEAQDDDESIYPNWATLQGKLGGLINYYKEMFSRLAKRDASQALAPNIEQCLEELIVEAAGGRRPDNMEVMLERFRNFSGKRDDGTRVSEAAEFDKAQDLANLRTLAAKQQRTIKELQTRLLSIGSPEEMQEMVTELSSQLQRQGQYLKESESCIRLLEEELELANSKIEQLKHQRRAAALEPGSLTKSERQQLVNQNEQLRKLVRQQEAEIEQLLAQLHLGEN
ncbi:hypothetical protein [Halioxenophilus sp. WMMB6]|uniref:hypothetical protein n=1 Tax=Halioxenophilus sp. WMMB6 TaxID=3073815 RepID=UPI00295E2BB3|nr:hypothetical protein [Halioxenophilus sp. WMMB6]